MPDVIIKGAIFIALRDAQSPIHEGPELLEPIPNDPAPGGEVERVNEAGPRKAACSE
jgi:hypothetical protein